MYPVDNNDVDDDDMTPSSELARQAHLLHLLHLDSTLRYFALARSKVAPHCGDPKEAPSLNSLRRLSEQVSDSNCFRQIVLKRALLHEYYL